MKRKKKTPQHFHSKRDMKEKETGRQGKDTSSLQGYERMCRARMPRKQRRFEVFGEKHRKKTKRADFPLD